MTDWLDIGIVLTNPYTPYVEENDGSVDWDSVTVASLQSIPHAGHKITRLFASGRWRTARTAARLSAPSAWRHVGSRFRTSINSLRRQIPSLLQALSSNFAPTLAIPYSTFSLSVPSHECAACQSSVRIKRDNAILAPCGHQYHVECMIALVENSMQTLSSFPPKCCLQTIPSKSFDKYLSRRQRSFFEQRQAEYNTPKRVYCSNPRCSHFLGARNKRLPIRVYPCPSASCDTRTCARCKACVDTPASCHECSHDPGHRATLQLGSRMGWVRCPACEELIERHGGCTHMTCVCGAQFCYRCRALWKTCNCVDWGDGIGADAREARLFAPLEDVGDLGARLTLWTPPGLERNGNGSGYAGGVRERAAGEAWWDVGRPRPRYCSMPQSDRVYPRSSAVDPVAVMVGVPPIAIIEPSSSGADLPRMSPTEAESPSFYPPFLLARGVLAQEARRRRASM